MIEVYGVALVGLIIGLVEFLKRVHVPKRLLPFASLTFGIAAGVIYVHPNDLKAGILVGIMIGLSATGLYSGTKNTIEKSDD